MAYKSTSQHDQWQRAVKELHHLLGGLPATALISESAFVRYLTADEGSAPAVSQLSPQALHNVEEFICEMDWQMASMDFTAFQQALDALRGSP